jgi:SAM-dependent methyltransferase
MKLSDMRALLDQRDIQLTKSLGQNFLHDKHQLERIADAGAVTKADKVLEIGPGLGPLTELLLERGGEVLAIEMDLRLVTVLRERFPNLTLIHGDALEYIRREPARLDGLEARGEPTVFRGVADSGGARARAAATEADDRDAAIGSRAAVDGAGG